LIRTSRIYNQDFPCIHPFAISSILQNHKRRMMQSPQNK
jgi:hypothetical protein